MTKQHYDGGPAFPLVEPDGPCGIYHGMTLRDWFAGQALIGLISDPEYDAPKKATAKWVYGMADAMLAAREESEGI